MKLSAKLVANFRRSLEGDFRVSFAGGKSSEAFSTKTPPEISPSNFTTRFCVCGGPTNLALSSPERVRRTMSCQISLRVSSQVP